MTVVATLLALIAAEGQVPSPAPSQLPPAGSPAVVRSIELRFPKQGNQSVIEPQTYLYYIQTRPSRPSEGVWVPYDEPAVLADFDRLWATNFLDDLSIEVENETYENGVVGKRIIYNLEERQRVRLVDYEGSDKIDRSKIDEKLKEVGVELRLDSFLDQGAVRRTEGVIRELMAEKGFQFAVVKHTVESLDSGTKLVKVVFDIDEGPKVKIREIEFVGNEAIDDGELRGQMKETKQHWFLSFVTGRGTYQSTKFEEDADKVIEHYRSKGYIAARVGQPEIKTLEDAEGGETRWVQLRIPVTEGSRYRVGNFSFDGNTVLQGEGLRPLFKLKTGDWYSEKRIRDGLDKAREVYGAGGYFEFTAYPDLQPRDLVSAQEGSELPGKSESAAPAEGDGHPEGGASAASAPVVDVVMRLQEGTQYFVNRIAFQGNRTTRDNVIRRELAVVEGGVFNTEALKTSIRRLNQLGYFKPLEQEGISVQKTPSTNDKVDITLKVEEQNRNQLTFGAGMSGIDGLFVNASYATSNFLGQGETLEVAIQTGTRTNNYQFGITEPYLFDRPISGGIALFSRKTDYLMSTDEVGYSEVRTGISVTGGYPIGRFTRFFSGYAYEVIDTAVDDAWLNSSGSGNAGDLVFNPFLDEGRHIESRITPSLVHNTVDNPITPRRGMRATGSFEVAGGLLGGTTDYIRPNAELILYIPHTRRTAIGLRGEIGWVKPFAGTTELPYYRRFFLGGENQIRGVNIRTVGPLDSQHRALGGNKFVLFNAEYYFDIFGPVRLLAFHDAGQAYSEGDPINLKLLRTSSGGELRVMMPVMNIPFRLIYAWNIYRDSFQPERTFKFAVGTTF